MHTLWLLLVACRGAGPGLMREFPVIARLLLLLRECVRDNAGASGGGAGEKLAGAGIVAV